MTNSPSTMIQAAGLTTAPDTEISVRDVFGLDVDMVVPAYSERSDYVPDFDPDYHFDFETTIAIIVSKSK